MSGEYFIKVKRALGIFYTECLYIARNYIMPAMEETGYFLSQVFTAILKGLETKDHSYKAEFGSPDELLSKTNTGFCVDGVRRLSDMHSFRNLLCCASTGMGKSTIISIPTIATTYGSFIINDPSGEQLKSCGAVLQAKGVKIIILDFSNPDRSAGFNFFDYCQSQSDMQKTAEMLVRHKLSSSSGDPFWRIQAENTIGIGMRIVAHQEPKYRNMANVRHIIQCLTANVGLVDTLVARCAKDAQLLQDYKALIALDIKLMTSIQATSLSALSVFSDTAVAKVTARSTFDVNKIRKEPHAIFIQCNTLDQKYYSSLISLTVELITKRIMSALPVKSDIPTYFILDELSSLYLPTLSITLANCRKYKIGIMMLLQSYEQLVDVYGKQDAESMRTNCFARIYMGAASHSTSVDVSQMLGKYQWEDDNGKRGIRELLTPQEVRQLPDNKAVLIAANHPPLLLDLRPYYKNPFLRLKTEQPYHEPKGQLSDFEVELISD